MSDLMQCITSVRILQVKQDRIIIFYLSLTLVKEIFFIRKINSRCRKISLNQVPT